MAKGLKILLAVAGIASILAGIFGVYHFISIPKGNDDNKLYVEFINTQDDADATIIYSDDVVIVIDTGEIIDSDTILGELENNNITAIDYLIISHGDKDHVGSAEAIMEKYPVSWVIAPDYDDDEMEALFAYIERNNISLECPKEITAIDAGSIRLTFYPPQEENYSKENNYSLATLVTYDSINMLFAGDAVKKRSKELEEVQWKDIALYKVPHHGRANSESQNLFEMICPEIAVVTSDSCDVEIIESADKCKSSIYYTRPDGLKFVSDGKILKLISK